MQFKSLFLPAFAAVLLAQISANGQTLIQTSATQPTPGARDIFSFTQPPGAFNATQDFSNNTPPGETFTTLNTATRFNLNSVTVQGVGNAGTVNNVSYQAGTFTLTLYSIAGTAATALTSQTYIFPDRTAATNYSTSYLTFTLTTPLVLTANTQYAYSIVGTTGYYGFAGSGGNAPVTTGGQAVGITAAGAVTNYVYSRNFDIGLTVPEPGTWALLLLGAAALPLVWTRRSVRTA